MKENAVQVKLCLPSLGGFPYHPGNVAHTLQIASLRPGIFATTRWALLDACKQEDQKLVRQALEEICQSYWYPVYAMIRHSGRKPEDAKDLAQDFFMKLLRGNRLASLDQSKGRFRSYLSTAVQRFLHDDHRRRWTFRRGRGCQLISIDTLQAEAWYAAELRSEVTPEVLYEQKWAATIIANTVEQLRIELVAERKSELFECFRCAVFTDMEPGFYQAAAKQQGMEIGALQTAVSRLRSRFRILLREEIGRTLSLGTGSEIDSEIKHLMHVVSSAHPLISNVV